MEKLGEDRLRNLVKEELAKFLKSRSNKGSIKEGEAFKAAKMRELVSREPHLQQIAQSEGLDLDDPEDLMELWRREVERNKRMKRKYKQASPQPAGG